MSFFNELKRRNVIRVAAGYIVLAWLVVQVVETIFPAFGFGDEAVRYVVIGFAVGFVPVVVFAWVFEWTPEGVRKDDGEVKQGPAVAAALELLEGKNVRNVQAAPLRAMAYHSLGDVEKFAESIAEIEQMGGWRAHSFLAEVYAFTGDIDRAFEALEMSIEQGGQVKEELFLPHWENLRDDPRWTALREELGMSEEKVGMLDFCPVLKVRTMIIKRKAQAIRRQDWFAVFVEILVVIVCQGRRVAGAAANTGPARYRTRPARCQTRGDCAP